jgi:hypothetical protein
MTVQHVFHSRADALAALERLATSARAEEAIALRMTPGAYVAAEDHAQR